MKATLLSLRFIILLIALPAILHAQTTQTLTADSIYLTNGAGNAELILENATRYTKGFLYNKGNGRTEFRRGMMKLNDSLYLFGDDTLNIHQAITTYRIKTSFIQNQRNSPQQGATFWIDSTAQIGATGGVSGLGVNTPPSITSALAIRQKSSNPGNVAVTVLNASGTAMTQILAANSFGGMIASNLNITGQHNTGYFRVAPANNGSAELNMIFHANGNIKKAAGNFSLVNIGTLGGALPSGIFEPTSGTSSFRALEITPIINQTGTANGAVYGIHYNPTLTSVLGKHYGLYINSGENYLGEKLLVGNSTSYGDYIAQFNGNVLTNGSISINGTKTLSKNSYGLYLGNVSTQGLIMGASNLMIWGDSTTASNLTSAASNIIIGNKTSQLNATGLRHLVVGHDAASGTGNLSNTAYKLGNDIVVFGHGSLKTDQNGSSNSDVVVVGNQSIHINAVNQQLKLVAVGNRINNGISNSGGTNLVLLGTDIKTSRASNNSIVIGNNSTAIKSGADFNAAGIGVTNTTIIGHNINYTGNGNVVLLGNSTQNTLLGLVENQGDYRLQIDGGLYLKAKATAPVTPLLGGVYVNSTNNSFYGYTTSWKKFLMEGDIPNNTWSLGGNSGTSPAANYIGTTDAQPLVFKTNNAEALRLSTSGHLHIGTTHNAMGYANRLDFGSGGNSDPIWFSRYNHAGDQSELRLNIGDDGGDRFTIGNHHHADSEWRPAFSVTAGGLVSIGTMSVPNGYKLAVGGNIISEKLTLKLQESWPDYVFLANYQLPTLRQVEEFIKRNHHLPGIPSAEEIKREGLQVGENQAQLLKKIEELTLYAIEQDKKIEQLEKENKKVQELEKRLIALEALLTGNK